MILITHQNLDANTQKKLDAYQASIDSLPNHAERVKQAKLKFSSRNKPTNKVFQAVKKSLREMSSGSWRCMYCEDSCADEVEHIYPKYFYPDKTFLWENYLYACGICNTKKNNNFAVLHASTGKTFTFPKRQRFSVHLLRGKTIFVDPRKENGMDFLRLELKHPFVFDLNPGLSQHDKERAQYTLDTLKLNREPLPDARENAYEGFVGRLNLYLEKKIDEAKFINYLKRAPHVTVWREMQRQYSERQDNPREDLAPSEFETLFDQAPEALNW